MTEFEENDRVEVLGNKISSEGLGRVCMPCHMNNLAEFEMGHVENFNDVYYGLVEKWTCVDCGKVDYWMPEDQKWSRDYESIHEELSCEYGD